eukprot:2168504-Amphidinium_carterae.1
MRATSLRQGTLTPQPEGAEQGKECGKTSTFEHTSERSTLVKRKALKFPRSDLETKHRCAPPQGGVGVPKSGSFSPCSLAVVMRWRCSSFALLLNFWLCTIANVDHQACF